MENNAFCCCCASETENVFQTCVYVKIYVCAAAAAFMRISCFGFIWWNLYFSHMDTWGNFFFFFWQSVLICLLLYLNMNLSMCLNEIQTPHLKDTPSRHMYSMLNAVKMGMHLSLKYAFLICQGYNYLQYMHCTVL